MHVLAQRMINDFDPSRHVFFALPFTKALATEFGSCVALAWVSKLLVAATDTNAPTSDSLEIADTALIKKSSTDLPLLDEVAWKHWCCGPVSTENTHKAMCRFIWAVMACISYNNDAPFESQLSGLLFTGADDGTFKVIYQQAASALSLAYGLDRSQDDGSRLRLAIAFSNEMERLGAERG